MAANIISISSDSSNVRQEVFPLDQWTITTRKGIIMQSKCTCKQITKGETTPNKDELCNICRHHSLLPRLNNMPDMLFNNNLLRLEHYTGVGIEFNALDALKCVEETKDPLKVAVADGWQSARADFPFAKSIVKPFDWTFTTNHRGAFLSSEKKTRKPVTTSEQSTIMPVNDRSQHSSDNESSQCGNIVAAADSSGIEYKCQPNNDRLCLAVEETDERIDVNKLKVREEILFYDDVSLYEDELADHGTAQYSVKVRVMPKCLFILARFYLRVDGVLARINDTRIYHEFNKRYLLREYTNREAKLASLDLPVSTVINPNELMNHLPLIQASYEKLTLPKLR